MELTIEFARRLLAEVAAKSGGPSRIPVKVHPTATDASRDRHWRRSNLVGVTNSRFLVRPINDHGVDEEVPEGTVKLWKSRISPEVAQIIDKVDREMRLSSSAKKALPLLAAAAASAVGPAVVPSDLPLATTAPLDVATMTPIKTEPVQVSSPAPAAAEGFRKHLEEFRRLKQTIAGEGLARLKALFDDLTAAREFVSQIEGEITDTTKELREFEVDIPAELRLDQSQKASAAQARPNSNWRPGRAKELKSKIGEHLRSVNNAWSSGPKILGAIGAGEVEKASTVLMPLVAEGYLERQGDRISTEYRLKSYKPSNVSLSRIPFSTAGSR